MNVFGVEVETMDEATAALRQRIGSNLRSLREMKGMSLAAVGAALDKNPQTIANYEAGTVGISYEMAWMLCNLYGVNIGMLGGRIDYEPPHGEVA